MRKNKSVKFIDAPSLRDGFDFSSPMIIQPPTFKTIADAYNHFVRHFKQEDFEEFEDDPDSPPVHEYPSGDMCDLLSYSPQSTKQVGSALNSQPVETAKDGQHAASEGEGRMTEPERVSSSTSE